MYFKSYTHAHQCLYGSVVYYTATSGLVWHIGSDSERCGLRWISAISLEFNLSRTIRCVCGVGARDIAAVWGRPFLCDANVRGRETTCLLTLVCWDMTITCTVQRTKQPLYYVGGVLKGYILRFDEEYLLLVRIQIFILRWSSIV